MSLCGGDGRWLSLTPLCPLPGSCVPSCSHTRGPRSDCAAVTLWLGGRVLGTGASVAARSLLSVAQGRCCDRLLGLAYEVSFPCYLFAWVPLVPRGLPRARS